MRQCRRSSGVSPPCVRRRRKLAGETPPSEVAAKRGRPRRTALKLRFAGKSASIAVIVITST
jgi:hypothetical protein